MEVMQVRQAHQLQQILSYCVNIAKGNGQWTMHPMVEFISQFVTQILIKSQFQNLD